MSQLLATQESAADMGHDALLLAAAQRRDATAFTALVNRYARLLFSIVWRMTRDPAESEDIAQEAFLRLWDDPHQLRDASKVRNWLVRVASNIAVDRMRVRAPSPLLDADVLDERAGSEEQIDKSRIAQRMDRALAALPERQRLALTLVQYEQFNHAAAADVLDVTVDALESLLARARRQLKQDLAGEWRELLAGLSE